MYWDANKVRVPDQDIDTLRDNMARAVRHFNSNYDINLTYFCGEENLGFWGSKVHCHFARERCCLCSECDNLARSGRGVFRNNFDPAVLDCKHETPDVWLTRMMYKDRRHNALGRFPPSANVVLLVSADFDFWRTMMDLKAKDCTVLLALPEDANQEFVTGFDAAWYVSNLVQGGDRIRGPNQ